MYHSQPTIVHALVVARMQQVGAELSWSRARRTHRRHGRLHREQRRRRDVLEAPIIPVIGAR